MLHINQFFNTAGNFSFSNQRSSLAGKHEESDLTAFFDILFAELLQKISWLKLKVWLTLVQLSMRVLACWAGKQHLAHKGNSASHLLLTDPVFYHAQMRVVGGQKTQQCRRQSWGRNGIKKEMIMIITLKLFKSELLKSRKIIDSLLYWQNMKRLIATLPQTV